MVSDDHRSENGQKRRYFLKLVGSGAPAVLAGCLGGDGGEDSPAGEATTAGGGDGETGTATSDDGIPYGGHLIDIGESAPQNLSPHRGAAGLGDIVVRDMMYSSLTQVDQDAELVGDLATEWTTNDALDSWTFVLNEDAKFVTGEDVLAQDVKATVDILRSERVPGGERSLYATESVEVEDDHRIRFDLSEPDSQLPVKFAEINNLLKIVPEQLKEDYDRIEGKDFGSGPLVLEDWETGVVYEFSAYDDYHHKDWLVQNPVPYIDKLTYRKVEDQVAQTNLLKDKSADVLHQPKGQVASRISNIDHAVLNKKATAGFTPVVLNNNIEPLADNRVRQAIKYAIDHEELAEAMAEEAVAAYHSPVSPLHPHFDPDIEDPFGPGSKPEKAQELLAEAGYEGGLELPTLYILNTTTSEAAVFQQQLGDVGIEFDLQTQPYDVWISETWFAEDKWYFSSWSARMSELTVLNLSWRSDGKWNTGYWQDEEMTELIQQANATVDDAELQDIMTNVQRKAHLDGPWLVIGFIERYWAHADYVKNVEPTGARSFDYVSEFAWMTEDAPDR